MGDKTLNGWRIAFIVTHIIQFILIWTMLQQYKFVDPSLVDLVKKEQSGDTIRVLAQLGRFDMAAMMLGAVSVMIAIAAIFGFLEVRSRSARIAEETAREESATVGKKVATEVAKAQMRPVANRIVAEYFDGKNINFDRLAVDYAMQAPGADNESIADALEGDAK